VQFSERALKLILEFEGLDRGGWPGGASGVTIGRGYDLGYHSLGQFAQDWKRWLKPSDYTRLMLCIGIKGQDAAQRARLVRGVEITTDAADHVFYSSQLPRFIGIARTAFTGFDDLPLDVQGALTSLVFNRGAAMGEPGEPSWDSRREMRAIRDAVAIGDLLEIARQLRLMKRLWEGKGLNGLIRRREAEAELVEAAAAAPVIS
jgi:GH24 family phage-related lysozyme (muramidase)